MDTDQTSHESEEAPVTFTDEMYTSQLEHLAERWRSHRASDLQLRYDTGELLNKQMGSPDIRQVRGEGSWKKAVDQLGVSQSELSRTRAFAHSFKSVQDFQEKHPEVRTWSEVKKLLPTLSPRGDKKEQQTNGVSTPRKLKGRSAPEFTKVKQSLKKLSSKIGSGRKTMTPDYKNALLEKFQDLAKAVEALLKIHVSIEADKEETLSLVRPVDAGTGHPLCA